MEPDKLLEVLRRIGIFLEKNLICEAKEYIKIELENLEDITPKRCQNTKYYFYDFYCQYCSNLNCSSNKLI